MESTNPNTVSDSGDLKLSRHHSQNRAERDRIRSEMRKRKIQGIIIAVFFLTVFAAGFIFLAKGCADDSPPTSAPI